jgi:hypothetical protein
MNGRADEETCCGGTEGWVDVFGRKTIRDLAVVTAITVVASLSALCVPNPDRQFRPYGRPPLDKMGHVFLGSRSGNGSSHRSLAVLAMASSLV